MSAGPRAHPHTHPGVLGTISALLRVLVVGLFVLTFLIQPFRIPSASMVPTLLVGDFVLVDKTAFGPGPRPGTLSGWFQSLLLPPVALRRGDLAVFHFPPDPNQLLVKRIIGIPGDRLRLRNGHVLLNDQPIPEPYAMYTDAQPDVFRDEFPNLHEADPNIDPHWWLALRHTLREDGNVLLPPDHYFALGDNRNNSEDSRYWGFVPRNGFVGRPLMVYFSVPNGADAPPGGPLPRLRWVANWLHQRIGVVR